MTTLKRHSSTESKLRGTIAELSLATDALRFYHQALLNLRRLRASKHVSGRVLALLVAAIDGMEDRVADGEAHLTLAHIAVTKAKREHEITKE